MKAALVFFRIEGYILMVHIPVRLHMHQKNEYEHKTINLPKQKNEYEPNIQIARIRVRYSANIRFLRKRTPPTVFSKCNRVLLLNIRKSRRKEKLHIFKTQNFDSYLWNQNQHYHFSS